jgi:hypothetical protein
VNITEMKGFGSKPLSKDDVYLRDTVMMIMIMIAIPPILYMFDASLIFKRKVYICISLCLEGSVNLRV